MDRKTWTREELAHYAAAHGLTNISAEEIDRMTELAQRVTQVGAQIPRMPSKENEPANIFKVPQ